MIRAETIAVGVSGRTDRVQHLLARICIERVRLAVWRKSDLVEADRLAVSAQQAVARAGHQDTALQRDLTLVLAELRGFQGRYEDQAKLADAALAALAKEGPNADPLDRASLLSVRAESEYYVGRPKAALPVYRQALGTLFEARQRDDGPYVAGRLARAYWEVGTTLIELHRYAEATTELARGEIVAQEVIAFEPASDDARRSYNILVVARAQALGLSGQTDAALAILRANFAQQKSEAAARHTPESIRNAAYASTLIGETLDAAGRKGDACLADRKALAEYEGLRSSGLLTPYDERGNLAQVNARIARNCT